MENLKHCMENERQMEALGLVAFLFLFSCIINSK